MKKIVRLIGLFLMMLLFVGSLFLAREGRIDIIQKNLENHNIYVKNLESAG